MTKSNDLKIAFTVSLFISLIIYHLLNFIEPIRNLYDLYKIIQIIVSGILAYFIIYNQLLTKLIFRKNFIGGYYEGSSGIFRRGEKLDPSKGINREFFTIKQTIFDTLISGRSFQANTNNFVSSWEGKLFKVEGNTFYFAVSLASETGELGIFHLTFDDLRNIEGFYYSCNPKRKEAFSISAKKVDAFTLSQKEIPKITTE